MIIFSGNEGLWLYPVTFTAVRIVSKVLAQLPSACNQKQNPYLRDQSQIRVYFMMLSSVDESMLRNFFLALVPTPQLKDYTGRTPKDLAKGRPELEALFK
jgi:hypothetical protein